MAVKPLVLIAFLVAAMAVPMAVAQPGLIGNLLGLIRITGTVFCTTNTSTVNGTTPAFPNALVQLQCGSTTVSSATTNGSGVFTMLLDPLTALLSSLLSSCKLVVNTPLATCNASLPAAGVLQSALTLLGTIVQGVLRIINIVPTGFVFVQ